MMQHLHDVLSNTETNRHRHVMRLELFIGGYTGPSYSVTWDDGRLEYRTADYGFMEVPAPTIEQPTPKRWQAFWRKLEALGVWDWPEECEADMRATDGTSWSIHLEYSGRVLRSGGSNAYPGTRDLEPSPEFRKYLAAVRSLLGGKRFS